MSYTPPPKILENYAKVLVNFALNGGEGIRKGETVRVMANEFAKPLYLEVCKAVWRSGGNVIEAYLPNETDAFGNLQVMYEAATEDAQFDYFPEKMLRGLVDDMDHQIVILGDADLHALEAVNPKRIMQLGKARKQFMDWRTEKESAGKFTWTLGLYGTEAMAAEVGMSLEEYWDQIISACFLDDQDPIARWHEVYSQIEITRTKLNALPIEKLHMIGEDADLWIRLGEQRRWMGGSGRNIPSYEIFTSPDWRGTEGWIRFNQPLYRYGNMVKGIRLEFKDGKVTSATAETNEQVLVEMVKTEGADKVGEFSLTDSRHSHITKFMAETLYDENMGGPYGNTHIALGMSYQDCYAGEPSNVSKDEWERLGFNDSSVHTDMISTTDRTVTAVLKDGSEQVIYKEGKFLV